MKKILLILFSYIFKLNFFFKKNRNSFKSNLSLRVKEKIFILIIFKSKINKRPL